MPPKRRYVMPPLVSVEGFSYYGCRTYSEYNYLRPGIASAIKRRHFQLALDLTSGYPREATVLDFGCGDGCFMPSLSTYFDSVIGVDFDKNQIRIAEMVVKQLGADNVKLVNSWGKTTSDVSALLGEKADVLFLLEVLEHIGDVGRQYESRIDFLKDLSALADSAIITVPRMTGPSFLLQRLGLRAFSHDLEPLTTKQVLMAGLLSNTEELEERWHNGHIGFNDRKFEKTLKNNFTLMKIRRGLFQNAYLVKLDN